MTDILEVTDQGRHALDIYMEKDSEVLHILTDELSVTDSEDSAAIRDKIRLYSGADASDLCVNLKTGAAYTESGRGDYTLEQTQLDELPDIQGNGVRNPYLDEYTGVWTVGIYERFQFADGTEGYVQKSQPRSEMRSVSHCRSTTIRGFPMWWTGTAVS